MLCSEHRAAGCHTMVIPVLSLTLPSVLSALFSLQEVLCYRRGIRLNQKVSGLKEAKAVLLHMV